MTVANEKSNHAGKQTTYDRVLSCVPKSKPDSGVCSNIRVVVRVSQIIFFFWGSYSWIRCLVPAIVFTYMVCARFVPKITSSAMEATTKLFKSWMITCLCLTRKRKKFLNFTKDED